MSYCWSDVIEFSGHTFECELIKNTVYSYPGNVIAVNGIPNIFLNDLAIISQQVDVPHTWRIRYVKHSSELSDKDISLAKSAILNDINNLGSHIISYVSKSDNGYKLLAAGSIRDKLNPDYYNPYFPVISRAVVAPDVRGLGLGSMIVYHRLGLVGSYFNVVPKAIHLATESPKILSSVRRYESQFGMKFVFIGIENYAVNGVKYKVDDYLSFQPNFIDEILTACDYLVSIDKGLTSVKFRNRLNSFIHEGVNSVKWSYLYDLFSQILKNLESYDRAKVEPIEEIFMVIDNIGTKDNV